MTDEQHIPTDRDIAFQAWRNDPDEDSEWSSFWDGWRARAAHDARVRAEGHREGHRTAHTDLRAEAEHPGTWLSGSAAETAALLRASARVRAEYVAPTDEQIAETLHPGWWAMVQSAGLKDHPEVVEDRERHLVEARAVLALLPGESREVVEARARSAERHRIASEFAAMSGGDPWLSDEVAAAIRGQEQPSPDPMGPPFAPVSTLPDGVFEQAHPPFVRDTRLDGETR